ncbi:MAG: MOSC domain-containing protein [Rhodocyclaceae bacterium]|nr:MOSC domain-containing protein [Rhodocyclaceae bacterium]MBX3668857.1 MOSC domain-containing protein [Rhodocyclaceae bacterium]
MTDIEVFVGTLGALGPDGTPSGIFKHRISLPIELGPNGLAGDIQADRKAHGGPEKALCHFPAQHYGRLAAQFPALRNALAPGSLGENLSCSGWDETTVHIGDVFALGTCRLQVSQPRSPCWKIDHKLGVADVARHIAEQALMGWYYRVLEGGTITPEARLELIARNADPVSLARLWQAHRAHRPRAEELRAIAQTPGLAPIWRKKLLERQSWLEKLLGRGGGGG